MRTTIGFKAVGPKCGTSDRILGATGAAALSTGLTIAALRNGKADIGIPVALRVVTGNQTKS